jgi:DNA topoisomerase-2
LLRGVTLQTLELTPSAIMKNKELSDLVRIIGLDWNDAHDIINPGEIREKVNKLNYKKIYALVDQDEDAFRILGILLAFFSKWPWLYRAGCIAKVNTPMMICTKGNNTVNIYSWTEYREKEKELNGYFIRYLKGLGSLKREELATALRTPKLQIFNLDEDYQMSLYKWFGKKHIKDRQNSLKENIMEE